MVWLFTTETEIFIVIWKRRSERVFRESWVKDFAGFIVCNGRRFYLTFTRKIQLRLAHLPRETDYKKYGPEWVRGPKAKYLAYSYFSNF